MPVKNNPLAPFINGDFLKPPERDSSSPLRKCGFPQVPLRKGGFRGLCFFWAIPHFHEDEFTTPSVPLC